MLVDHGGMHLCVISVETAVSVAQKSVTTAMRDLEMDAVPNAKLRKIMYAVMRAKHLAVIA